MSLILRARSRDCGGGGDVPRPSSNNARTGREGKQTPQTVRRRAEGRARLDVHERQDLFPLRGGLVGAAPSGKETSRLPASCKMTTRGALRAPLSGKKREVAKGGGNSHFDIEALRALALPYFLKGIRQMPAASSACGEDKPARLSGAAGYASRFLWEEFPG